jgi:hypothetical protein
MLKKEALEKLAKLSKIEVSILEAAIKATEEQDIAISELNVFTVDELATRDSNAKKTGYNEGKVAGLEIAVKEQKEKLGIDVEGKTLDVLIDAYGKKILIDAKVEPNAKVAELTTSLKKVQDNLAAEIEAKKQLEGTISSIKTENTLISMFPDNVSDILSKNEILGIVKAKYEFVNEDGKLVVKENGQIVKDATTQNAIDPKDVIKSYLTERKLVVDGDPNRQGRGAGGDAGKGGAILKLSELEKQFKDADKSLQGAEFNAALESAMKANPSFDLNA